MIQCRMVCSWKLRQFPGGKPEQSVTGFLIFGTWAFRQNTGVKVATDKRLISHIYPIVWQLRYKSDKRTRQRHASYHEITSVPGTPILL